MRVGPEGRLDNRKIGFVDCGRIVAVCFIKVVFKGVIDGIDCGFAFFVAIKSVKIGFLDEKGDYGEGGKG